MNITYNIKLEKELIKLGFKRNYFSDRSGYWMTKKIKYKNLDLVIYCETDNKLLLLECRVGQYSGHKLEMHKFYDPIKKYNLTLDNVKKLIKRYK